MLPNDEILKRVCIDEKLISTLASSHPSSLHVSCSTVSPHTSRELSALHLSHVASSSRYVSAPVFARPDGLAKSQASFALSGSCPAAVSAATALLSPSNGRVFTFGPDPGSGNVAKLCGNFLIAAAIESLAESLALAEANGVDRIAVKDMLTSTIFDCLIYKGYGQRVSERDHRPGGFALSLGLKDVSLVLDTAHRANVPMPFASLLKDQFAQSMAKGREGLDWSAVALNASENSGVDVSDAIRTSADSLPESLKPFNVASAARDKRTASLNAGLIQKRLFSTRRPAMKEEVVDPTFLEAHLRLMDFSAKKKAAATAGGGATGAMDVTVGALKKNMLVDAAMLEKHLSFLQDFKSCTL